MAELASGAVSSLLGVIRDEAKQLGRVRHDVKFIQEEMESMNSFLEYLASRVSAGGDNAEQIRTWMNQVRQLAQDSNNCIGLYLYRSNSEIHLPRRGLRRYTAWLPWFVHKMVAQHRAAIQLRVLRDRARDIGDRRLRYSVEIPGKAPAAAVAALPSLVHAAAASAPSGDNDEDGDDELVVAAPPTNYYHPRRAIFELPTPEEDVRVKLAEWIRNVAQRNTAEEESIPSVAIVVPDKEEILAIAQEASAMWTKHCRRSVLLVDIPAVHFYSQLLRTQDILYYILRELQPSKPQLPQQESLVGGEEVDINKIKSLISSEKLVLIDEIMKDIQGMKVDDKISEIKSTIGQMKGGQLQLDVEQMNEDQLDLPESTKDEPLGILLRALWQLKLKPAEVVSAIKQHQERKKATLSHEDIIKETAKKLKEHMEEEAGVKLKLKEHLGEEAGAKPICLKEAHYEHILREVFPVTSRKLLHTQQQDQKQATAVTTTGTVILVEVQIKEMIRKDLQYLQEDKSVNKLETADGIPDALIKETLKKIGEIQWKMKEQLKIKEIMEKINNCLKRQGGQILVMLKLDHDYVSGWEETRNAFSLMGCIAGALILTFKENIARAKEYCCPPQEPIDYSVLGLYHSTALELTKKQMIEDSPQIFLDILYKCKQHEFCMKIFVHALYANPKRSNQELRNLNKALQEDPENSLDSIAKKMFKFSYSDLPKEYQSCLLYLAIFPRQQSIRRSTLIGRWVVEGLITKEHWDNSVRSANHCFDVLIDRWLVYPADVGCTGQVKSCVIGDLVHGFITKIAKKQRIVETRLPHHLACHFSIFNNLQFRRSDTIHRFLREIHEESSRVIKVLDLEGCQCFHGKNQRYLKDICRKMKLLKYLSLRGTDVSQLPSDINDLYELEVLDIRQTNVPASATKKVLLSNLKRLLAGRVVLNSGACSTELSSVELPDKIEKMLNMEVLSNVKARNHHVLKDIRTLWQLRKLGVVIEDNDKLIQSLIRAISDLRWCLKSLSVTLPMTEQDPSNEDFPSTVLRYNKQRPKLHIESLSITGTTKKGQLLQLLTKHIDFFQLAKITLTGTRLKQDDLKVLNKLPNMVCLRLRDKAYIDGKLTFKKEEFKNLKCFLVEGSNMTDIFFEGGALELEKIILCSTDGIQSLSRVEDLPELKEVELNNNNKLSLFDKAEKVSKVTLCGTKLSQDDLKMFAKIRYMRCLVLKEKACVESEIMFNKHEFPRLNLLIVDGSAITKIEFASGSAPKLEKIIWSFTKGTVGSLSGIENLPKLKELEFNGDLIPGEVKEAINKLKNKPNIIHNKPENQYQEELF